MKRAGEMLRGSLPPALIISAGLHVVILSHTGLNEYLWPEKEEPKIMKVTLQTTGIRKISDNALPAVDNYPPALTGEGRAKPETIPPESISLDTEDPLYRTYFEVLKGMIAGSWVYPVEAHRPGEGGRVLLEFCLDREGWLTRVTVAESSGSLNLDRAVVEAVQRTAPFPPPPPSIQRDLFLVSALFIYER
jgi:protein TonB